MPLIRQMLIVCLIAAVLGGGYYAYGALNAGGDETANAGQGRGGGAVKVEVAKASLKAFSTAIEAVGSTIAKQSITIQPNVDGTVEAVLFTAGQEVKQGQPLLKMDQTLEEAALEEAKAALVQVDLELERAEALRTNQVVSKATLEGIKARRAAANAAVIRAEKQLADRTLRAPFAGTTGISSVDVGARIGDNTIVTTLDDLQSVELEFAISEQYFGIIQKNMQITAVSSAFEGKTFSGQITEVGSRIDAVSRSFSVRATLPNEDKALPSGMFMRIIIALEQNEAVSVPEEAIVAEGGGSYIFEVIDNKSIRKEISLGRRVPGFVEVTQGLEVGASVVVRGTNKVRSNGAVEIVDPNAPEKPKERPQVGGNAIGKAS